MKIRIIILMIGIFGLSGCNVKNSKDIVNDLQKKLDQDFKKNDELIKTLEKSFVQGGQPGKIRISGVIVNDTSKTDDRINVVVKGGIAKDGSEANIEKDSQPVLSGTNDKVDLTKISELKSLIAVGCDKKTVAEFAEKRQLEVQSLPAPITESMIVVTARTIVLCGKLEDLKYDFLTVESDELILDSVDYTKIGTTGFSTFTTNKLVLMGSNKIMTEGFSSSMNLLMAPPLNINVMKEISSNEDGKLLIMSVGSNYVAKSK